ncbi:hypothetical protein [uncultured Alistipes sp.]|jgi:hypothetical protein|uniref:hypothetical protein n=1 Tax=uncultured Alistipes sp. TaxID=538949 RepID=UPI0025FE1416|nr:hypothetical protein [uncultured Alistipes sp.]
MNQNSLSVEDAANCIALYLQVRTDEPFEVEKRNNSFFIHTFDIPEAVIVFANSNQPNNALIHFNGKLLSQFMRFDENSIHRFIRDMFGNSVSDAQIKAVQMLGEDIPSSLELQITINQSEKSRQYPDFRTTNDTNVNFLLSQMGIYYKSLGIDLCANSAGNIINIMPSNHVLFDNMQITLTRENKILMFNIHSMQPHYLLYLKYKIDKTGNFLSVKVNKVHIEKQGEAYRAMLLF